MTLLFARRALRYVGAKQMKWAKKASWPDPGDEARTPHGRPSPSAPAWVLAQRALLWCVPAAKKVGVAYSTAPSARQWVVRVSSPLGSGHPRGRGTRGTRRAAAPCVQSRVQFVRGGPIATGSHPLRAHLRQREPTAHLAARAREGPEALRAHRRRVQPRAHHATPIWDRHAAEPPGARRARVDPGTRRQRTPAGDQLLEAMPSPRVPDIPSARGMRERRPRPPSWARRRAMRPAPCSTRSYANTWRASSPP
jgi:hypothetical protein